MKLTQAILEDKMRFHLERAKKELMKAKPESDPDKAPIMPCAVALWDSGTEKEYRAGWADNREKHIWGNVISRACALTHASAIIGRFITTMVNSIMIGKELGIQPSEMNFAEYQERLFGYVKKSTGQDRLSGLPEKFRLDCITICAMGPRFKDSVLNQSYEFRDGVWTFPPNPHGANGFNQAQINVIPKWWQ